MKSSWRIAMLLGLGSSAHGEVCSQFQNCNDCLAPNKEGKLNCGWCSPKAAEFANGTAATRCMDHTSKGWDCFHLYMHDGCIAGYVCDEAKGQCKLSAPGTGDTLANCQKQCGKHPKTEAYVCNSKTLKCEKGIGGSSEKECESTCGNKTPDALVGLWRGFDVQTGFSLGEYDLSFGKSNVSWGALGSASANQATVQQLGPTLMRLTMTAPADVKGEVRYASFSSPGWPTGPETQGTSIAIQRGDSHQAPPS
eukprot:gnl/TRDRNA2_/TRDRNA2_161757_c1_seq2.p1 gnl/TRDRNA2_/TRDRNA2_161757_c1~~gnl/TRDRNA2_/TRDRNA2_161757_c1_seq2.p1  ORF type:complete len:252 (-),score=49.40 gnl/TRDRNA2_/TRDRNA2_161757_c1_seq2:75-830(-)